MKKIFKGLMAFLLVWQVFIGISLRQAQRVSSQETTSAQEGLDTSVAIFQREYPLANIEAIQLELDRINEVYLINIKGYDANSTYSLEVEYVDYGVRQQVFSDGLFKMQPRETEAPAIDDERAELQMNRLISLDEATEIALAEGNHQGVAVKWTLFSDTREWWDIFNAAEENENPIWLVEMDYEPVESAEVSTTTSDETSQAESSESSNINIFGQEASEANEEIIQVTEVRIDAKTGQVLRDPVLE